MDEPIYHERFPEDEPITISARTFGLKGAMPELRRWNDRLTADEVVGVSQQQYRGQYSAPRRDKRFWWGFVLCAAVGAFLAWLLMQAF